MSPIFCPYMFFRTKIIFNELTSHSNRPPLIVLVVLLYYQLKDTYSLLICLNL